MVRRMLIAAGILAVNGFPLLATEPDFKDVLSLEGAGNPRISPDGATIAYQVTTTDWDDNRYDTEIYLARRGEEPFQLTRTRGGSSRNPKWSPDGRWIAFLADRGDGNQVQSIRAGGGEAIQLTAVEEGVEDFEWSPDGRSLALTLSDSPDSDDEKREELYGEFAAEDEEFRMSHLWLLDVEAAMKSNGGIERPAEEEDEEDGDEEARDGEARDGEARDGEARDGEARDGEARDGEARDGEARDGEDEDGEDSGLVRLTGGDFTVGGLDFSPDGRHIVFSHRPDPRVLSFEKSDLSVVDVATGEVHSLVERPGSDDSPLYSPDGKWIVFSTANGRNDYYENSVLSRIPAAGGAIAVLTAGFDENPSLVAWLADGIRFLALERTARRLFHLDPESGEIRRLLDGPSLIWSVDFSADGTNMAVQGESGETLDEIYRGTSASVELEAVTDMTRQVTAWPAPRHEVITWESRDGAEIEGVLVKPADCVIPPGSPQGDCEPGEPRPLLVIIHGGPTWLSMPQRVYGYVYPVQQWLAKGAVILMPNYRGSAGYGEAFRSLNVRNLGVGDAWDVLSGVDHLVDAGIADPERLGAMGWSQGGYISAFLTTTSDRFRAISVGAGISNWITYYVNTDIHPFTRHYLEATPWEDREIYDKTSPIHYVRQAKTPTLIQHGEFDRRVPTPNAYELFQGLEDVGVDTRLVIYKGFGHGISKPKERLAAVWHNWQWFGKYVWGEEIDLPLETRKTDRRSLVVQGSGRTHEGRP